MEPEQALQILDQAVALTPLNRQQHVQVSEALKVLYEVCVSKKEDKSDTKPGVSKK